MSQSHFPVLLVVALAGSGCGGTVCDPVYGCLNRPSELDPARSELQPTLLPSRMRVGDTVRYEVLFHGQWEASGYATWATSDATVAIWRGPSPPCPLNRCAVLEALTPGTILVMVGMCLGGDVAGCGGDTARLTVVKGEQ
jgi:hypothetical protein